MQKQKPPISLVVIVIMLTMIVVTLAASRRNRTPSSQEQEQILLKQIKESEKKRAEIRNRFPTVEYDDPRDLTSDPDKAAKRQIKNRRYDKYRWVTSQNNYSYEEATLSDHSWINLPAIPVAESDVIVIGNVVSREAHLSNNKSGVYSEFSVQIIEALKNNSSISVKAGDTLVADRPGGIVKYSADNTLLYHIAGKGMPRLGGRYVLFLSIPDNKEEPDQNYVIITGYEISMGKVIPLDVLSQFAVFNNSTEETFLASVRKAINNAK